MTEILMAQAIKEEKAKASEVELCRDEKGEKKGNREKANWHEQRKN